MALASPSTLQLGKPGRMVRMWLLSLSGMVERYHNIPTITRDTIGEHTYGVLWLVVELYKPALPPAHVLLGALAHDTPEVNWGDITAPTKRLMGIKEAYAKLEDVSYAALDISVQLTAEEHRKIKMADTMDAMLHCCYERALGNQMVCEVIDTFYRWAREIAHPGKELEMLEEIMDIWRTFDGVNP